MGAFVKVDTYANISVVERDGKILEILDELCGCDFIEVVHPYGLEQPYVMIVDESGILKERDLNLLGSMLYLVPGLQPSPIVGDIVIVKEIFYPEPDIVPLDSEEAITICENLKAQYSFLQEAADEKTEKS